MKVELNAIQIGNLCYFLRLTLGTTDVRGAKPEVLLELASLLKLLEANIEKDQEKSLPELDADPPNRAARRKAEKTAKKAKKAKA